MKKILTVILGILLFIFPMTACMEKEETFNPDVPLLEAYDVIEIAGWGNEDGWENIKKQWTTWETDEGGYFIEEGYLLAHNYSTFKDFLETYTTLSAKDLCNKSLFDDHVVVFARLNLSGGRKSVSYSDFAFDGETISFNLSVTWDLTYATDSCCDLVVMPKTEAFKNYSSQKTYAWNVTSTRNY